mmetsp:Transcript_4782/g.30282  ORF Transcript_4782/g.30282 Transcript_4782/m.30282 type:complete len:91 (+) Transcript_4782:181-453(+)
MSDLRNGYPGMGPERHAPPRCNKTEQGYLGVRESALQFNDWDTPRGLLVQPTSARTRRCRNKHGVRGAESETSSTLEHHLGTLLLRVERF